MRYIGSKASTVEVVRAIAVSAMAGRSCVAQTFCDPFGGIGTISSKFKADGWSVTVADHLLFAHMYQRVRLERNRSPSFTALKKELEVKTQGACQIESHLCSLPGRAGWVTENFSGSRLFFTEENAMKIDAILSRIYDWKESKLISAFESQVLLVSLINAADKVANTAGTYYAHLKSFGRKSLQQLNLKIIPPVFGARPATCLMQDALDTVGSSYFDLLYLDPPYSARSYDRYYHFPQTIALQEEPQCIGKGGLPTRNQIRSLFESPRTASEAFSRLVEVAKFRVMIVQYSATGIIPLRTIKDILSVRGKVSEYIVEASGYTTVSKPRREEQSLFVVHAR